MSISFRMQERFRRRSLTRRVVASLYCFFALSYLAWRLTTFNNYALVLSSVYYLADVIAVSLGLATIFVSLKYRHRTPPPVTPGLSVDLFVPVYKEPIDIIRQTVMAAVGVDYPHKTLVLDDGRRDEVRKIAEEFNCEYVVRKDNQFHKAGNLNHALKFSKAEFVAVFDADFVAMPHALHSLLGFFHDEKVCMAQAPQDFL